MTIQLTPEDEKIVQQRLASGVFRSVEEVIHHALQVQEADEARLALHRKEVGHRLDLAMEEFARGGGIPASEVRARLQEMKAKRSPEADERAVRSFFVRLTRPL